MEDATEGAILAQERPVRHRGVGWQIFWFLFHLAVVYAIVNVCTPLLARWTRDTLLPLLQHPSSSGRFEYLYSHLFVFSFIPGFVAGLVNARFRHKAAQFVWLLPALILAYKFAMFPSPSVLQGQLSAAFHQYFAGGFLRFRIFGIGTSFCQSLVRTPIWREGELRRTSRLLYTLASDTAWQRG